MKRILVPVLLSAFVWPGAGQFYNRERVKGVLFSVGTAVLLVWLLIRIIGAIVSSLPPTLEPMTEAQVRHLAETIMFSHWVFFRTLFYALLALWGYGVVDAFLGGRARARKAEPGR